MLILALSNIFLCVQGFHGVTSDGAHSGYHVGYFTDSNFPKGLRQLQILPVVESPQRNRYILGAVQHLRFRPVIYGKNSQTDKEFEIVGEFTHSSGHPLHIHETWSFQEDIDKWVNEGGYVVFDFAGEDWWRREIPGQKKPKKKKECWSCKKTLPTKRKTRLMADGSLFFEDQKDFWRKYERAPKK